MLLGIGLAIASFSITAFLTWGWIKIAEAKKIQDQPERRRLHQVSIPRAGGVSIALVMIVSGICIFLLLPNKNPLWPLIIISLILYGTLGLRDDLKPLHTTPKLLAHVLAAIVIFLIALFPLASGVPVSSITALAYLVFVNIWNFMDGSNGMVSMQGFIISISLLALSNFSDATSFYIIIFAGSCLGFLLFNFPIARVFLGDVGSHVQGAVVVGLVLLAYSEAAWTILEILCLTSALWIDALFTLIRRSYRGCKVTQAHRSHLYQYLIRSGQSHTAVCLYYGAWTVSIVLVIALGRQLTALSQQIFLLAVICAACVLHQYLRLFVLKSHSNKYRAQ